MKEKIKTAPKSPGVYFFKNQRATVLYVGKANSIHARLRQYFSAQKNTHPKTEALVREATDIEWQICESEADALITEAHYIKKYNPKYNVVLRDDKNYSFVVISQELYPRITLTHQPHMFRGRTSKHIIGPFTDSGALKETIRMLRGAYPYCTCKPSTKRACLNVHLGRCLAPCVRPEAIAQTKRNVNAIATILRGKKDSILKKLETRMRASARAEKFEKAHEYKQQLERIRSVFSHRFIFKRLENPVQTPSSWAIAQKQLQTFLMSKKTINRVECYDISNLNGTHTVGSMVVFEHGAPAKGEYRKFKIKNSGDTPDDPRMMGEMLKRRMKHPEWPTPDLIVVDGGITQLGAACAVIPKRQLIIGLAKKLEEMYVPDKVKPVLAERVGKETKLFLQHIRDEAHRFAVTYHKKVRSKHFIPTR